MSAPKRIQRQRTKGWRMPEGAIYVGRPTKWGNWLRVGECSPWAPYEPMDAAEVVAVFRYAMTDAIKWTTGVVARFPELRGHDLCCWCLLDQPCHADVLLELANA